MGRKSYTKHGLTKHPLYFIWVGMVARCHDPENRKFSKYGARGIAVCGLWRESIEAFIQDMGDRPEGTTLDRIDTHGDYEPENCRWATPLQQSNNRRDNHLLTHNGVTQSMAAWARELGCGDTTISERLKAGWSESRAVSQPVRGR